MFNDRYRMATMQSSILKTADFIVVSLNDYF